MNDMSADKVFEISYLNKKLPRRRFLGDAERFQGPAFYRRLSKLEVGESIPKGVYTSAGIKDIKRAV